MGYLAIARQWRPTQFDDLVGQTHVVQTLKNAIRFNRVSHAYLFSGARGIGKTSVARIFAKALRCPNVKDATPCSQCPECLAIAEGRAVDVVEIDGASNNGVEAVRGIRENVAYGAASGKYKIYIIDEVHMLSLSAFNALLKTLEEPPDHVIFIFATTEVQKIPLTIVSRCQRFEFRRLTNQQIVVRLQQILAAEKIQISEEGLRAMASHSDGSLRDALSLLDQVLSYFGQKGVEGPALIEKQVVEALGVNDSSTVRAFLSAILGKDIPSIVSLINETHLSGVDLKHFSERCLEEIRLLYLIALGRDTKQTLNADALDISLGQFNELSEIAKKAPLVQIERMSQILAKAISQLGWSSLPRFVLEMAAVRMAKIADLDKVESALIRGIEIAVPEEVQVAAPQPKHEPEVKPELKREPEPKVQTKPPAAPTVPADLEEPPPIEDSEVPPPMMQAPIAPEPVALSWKGFVDTVIKKRPLLGALLSHANFKMETAEGGARLVKLAFPPSSFYERQASDPKSRSEIEDQIRSYFGPNAKLVLSQDIGDASLSLAESRRKNEEEAKQTVLSHPTLLRMKEALNADIVEVNGEPTH